MKSRTLLVALAVTVFFVVGLPGAAAAADATAIDGSAPSAQQVTDAGTGGTGPAIVCPVFSPDGYDCPDCATGGPIVCM